MSLDQPAVPLGLPISFDQWLYFFTLAVLVAALAASANLLRGRIGRALIAIRDHPVAAQASGIDTTWFKAAAFGVSAMFAGIAGALATLALQYIAPTLFGIFLSFGFLIGIAVGGLASLSGALYGAIFMQAIFLVVGVVATTLPTGPTFLIYGVVLILVMHFMPGGLASVVQRWLSPAPAEPSVPKPLR